MKQTAPTPHSCAPGYLRRARKRSPRQPFPVPPGCAGAGGRRIPVDSRSALPAVRAADADRRNLINDLFYYRKEATAKTAGSNEPARKADFAARH